MLEQGDSLCPLCRQPLGQQGQEHLRREYETHGQESRRLYDENAVEQEALEARRKEVAAALSRSEVELDKEGLRVEAKTANLERDRAESIGARAEIEEVGTDLERTERLVKSNDFAQEERQALSNLDSELSSLGYDAERHNLVREELKALDRFDELHRRLLEAVERLPVERDSLGRAGEMLARRQQEIRDAEDRGAALQTELETLPSQESRLGEAEARVAELDLQRNAALVDKGVLEQQIARSDALENEIRQQEHERHKLLDEKAIYDELTVAFGKNGIQALIIETAIPQLENDANELLARLTDNRMSLKLQLQEGRKESRTGQPSEELDIRIADEVGTRSYETFSGGEAFRIDFALRIALSKLLARRSGAPLPILFIDEGFGSQDSAGQDRLTEAIQSIQDDFQKIIVITHIDEIKQAFPVRIEVTKTSSGSTFVSV